MSVYDTAVEDSNESNDDHTTLSTYAEFAAQRAERHELPRTEPCDCDRIHCFHNVDYDQLNARVEEVKDISAGPQ